MAGNSAGAAKRLARRVGVDVDTFLARVAAGEKYCWRCKSMHPRSAFDGDPTRRDGLNPSCRDSRNLAAKARYQPKPRVDRRGAIRVAGRHGDAKQARARVNHRVEIGLWPHPNTIACTDCGHVHTHGERRHEYDHYLGYAAEHHLDVQVVCTTCHRKREQSRE